jgi:hypothetical protein
MLPLAFKIARAFGKIRRGLLSGGPKEVMIYPATSYVL